MLSRKLLEKVLHQAQTSACHSWEYGTVFEALLEYHNPSTSIYNNPFPNKQNPVLIEEQVPALRYVRPFILTNSDQLCEGNGTYLLAAKWLYFTPTSSSIPKDNLHKWPAHNFYPAAVKLFLLTQTDLIHGTLEN
jgi:hypothetical protein